MPCRRKCGQAQGLSWEDPLKRKKRLYEKSWSLPVTIEPRCRSIKSNILDKFPLGVHIFISDSLVVLILNHIMFSDISVQSFAWNLTTKISARKVIDAEFVLWRTKWSLLNELVLTKNLWKLNMYKPAIGLAPMGYIYTFQTRRFFCNPQNLQGCIFCQLWTLKGSLLFL